MSKALVTYFSASGTTRKVAEKIKTAIEGDIFEIEPVEKYTLRDLNWLNPKSRSSIEMKDKSSRPEVKNKVANLNEYDKVIIGFPVWWYTAPTIINTFIEENNLEGKRIYVFVTSGSSGCQGSFNDLKNAYSNLNFISARRFTKRESDEEYINWINE